MRSLSKPRLFHLGYSSRHWFVVSHAIISDGGSPVQYVDAKFTIKVINVNEPPSLVTLNKNDVSKGHTIWNILNCQPLLRRISTLLLSAIRCQHHYDLAGWCETLFKWVFCWLSYWFIQVFENPPAGTTIGSFTAIDPDNVSGAKQQQITYTVLNTAGGIFKVVGNTLQVSWKDENWTIHMPCYW